MKVHNTVKELLEAYAEFMFDYQGTTIESTYDLLADEFLASNSLALGKPEPLVKNKDCDNDFICYLYESGRCSAKCFKPCGDIGCIAV